MRTLNGRLVTVSATDGLRLKGYLAVGESNVATIVHIHGNFGNFYENEFIPIMAEAYSAAGVNFLSVNNRGHDGMAEAYRDSTLVYVGGAIELPDQCLYDIEGAAQFAARLGPRVILQGHSFGCARVLAYILQYQKGQEFILLSPASPYSLQRQYISPESVPHQVERLKHEYAGHMDALVPPREFGIRGRGAEYHIPISARTLVALLEGPMLAILRYDRPLSFRLDAKGFVYYGGKDALWTESKTEVHNFFAQRVSELHFCYREHGDHHFHGIETSVVAEIVGWVCSDNSGGPSP